MYVWAVDVSFIINHLGEERYKYYGAVTPPLIRSSNFSFNTVDELRQAFASEKNVYLYTRGNNPTTEILRKKLAALAGADDALVFSSGVAAIAAAIMSHVKAGDHIVCVQKPYSWTERLLRDYLPRFGVTTTFVDGTNTDNYVKASTSATKVWMLESPNTFTFELQDIEALTTLAKERNIVTVADNSYCTSLGQRCIEMGVDIEVHSASKYYGGHSDMVAGVLLAGRETVKKIFETEWMNLGAILSPDEAWMMLRSLRTLPLRLQRIQQTTEEVVRFLENHPLVEKVFYPFSNSHPQYQLARKQMKWCGGLFSALLRLETTEKVEEFCNHLRAFLMAVSWGGHESLVLPACSFFPRGQLSDDRYPYNLVRFYIGLEDASYLIGDLQNAFDQDKAKNVSQL
ncbi:MAG: aminotransferase class I/II-fold pyridoxal phosphate-dependent enzyme [Chitinophagales bacterium]|nr:aminotransferase class I/II-fold pyridoxal phosphate-dependent enzyme [Chitinophagales bacterium]MDW8418949.1 aminotransferase class I/II-fold pyridoxal phosphate-dependent enzyme [Chitinophagales bacterium]